VAKLNEVLAYKKSAVTIGRASTDPSMGVWIVFLVWKLAGWRNGQKLTLFPSALELLSP
jgi:hypothetical protein